jgi:hypothetical protein
MIAGAMVLTLTMAKKAATKTSPFNLKLAAPTWGGPKGQTMKILQLTGTERHSVYTVIGTLGIAEGTILVGVRSISKNKYRLRVVGYTPSGLLIPAKILESALPDWGLNVFTVHCSVVFSGENLKKNMVASQCQVTALTQQWGKENLLNEGYSNSFIEAVKSSQPKPLQLPKHDAKNFW